MGKSSLEGAENLIKLSQDLGIVTLSLVFRKLSLRQIK
jgi:hypothetical protein